MQRLRDAFDQGHVVLDLEASDMASAIRETVQHMAAQGTLSVQAVDQIVSALLEREQKSPTALGHAMAIPHAYLDGIEKQVVQFVRLAHPINMGAPDGIPTHFLFFLLGPPGASAEHLDTLASVARLMSNDEFRYDLGEAKNKTDLLNAMQSFADVSALPYLPTPEAGVGLDYSGRLFGGLLSDTVRSLAHVRGLAETEEVVIPGGDTQERVIHVQENRVTGLAIHILIALSLLVLPLLNFVPMAVLYGVFLYMGVVSLTGNQFFERLTLWLTDPGLYPRTHYLRQAPKKIIHRFTLIQLACLIALCVVTLSSNQSLRLSFPLFIALLVPVRLLVGRVFRYENLTELEAEETPHEEETHWSA